MLLAALAVVFLTAAVQAQESSLIRFVQLDAGSPAIDIQLNGENAAADLRFGEASARVSVRAGLAQLSTNLAGTTIELGSQQIALPAGPATLILGAVDTSLVHVISEDLEPLSSGAARLALFNSLDTDVRVSLMTRADNQALDFQLAASAASSPLEISAAAYDLLITAADNDMAAGPVSQPFSAGTVNLLIIHGTPAEPALA